MGRDGPVFTASEQVSFLLSASLETGVNEASLRGLPWVWEMQVYGVWCWAVPLRLPFLQPGIIREKLWNWGEATENVLLINWREENNGGTLSLFLFSGSSAWVFPGELAFSHIPSVCYGPKRPVPFLPVDIKLRLVSRNIALHSCMSESCWNGRSFPL